MSPDTLRVLGQAWNVATASATLSAGVIPTSRSMAQEGNSGEN